MPFFAVITCVGSIIGGLVLVIGMFSAKSAPQEASIAALAIALGVLPYVFFRAIQLWISESRDQAFRAAVLAKLAEGQAEREKTNQLLQAQADRAKAIREQARHTS